MGNHEMDSLLLIVKISRMNKQTRLFHQSNDQILFRNGKIFADGGHQIKTSFGGNNLKGPRLEVLQSQSPSGCDFLPIVIQKIFPLGKERRQGLLDGNMATEKGV